MTAFHRIHVHACAILLAVAVTGIGRPTRVAAQTSAMPTAAMASAGPHLSDADHDGQRDFDWMTGKWKASLKRLVKPLTGSTTWVSYEGTQVTQSIWGGRACMDEFSVNDPKSNLRIDALTVRLYNPKSRQWSIYWANATNGNFSLPATVGGFKNGRGEFYDHEEWEGRMILVRYVWSDITPTSAHFEQAFSTDGGKSWEVNWISDLTRVKE